MAVTRDQVLQWLGTGWSIQRRNVSLATWNDPDQLTQWLVARALLGESLVYDEPAATAGFRVAWMAYEP